ncbi:SigE family RNA polymerase sigma factor [Dermatophilaceae bacterium Soc4.6]
MAERSAASGERSIGALRADDALTDLYAAHWAPLVRLAWMLVHDQAKAQDVVQDVFVASHPRLAELRDRGTALAYLRRGVVNRCTSTHRHRTVEDRGLRSVANDPRSLGRAQVASAEEQVVARSDGGRLISALRLLPERQRQVVVLRYYADLSEHQTAEALGITTGAVKSHAHRGLTALRDVLGGTR